MKIIINIIITLITLSSALSQSIPDKWLTYYEQSGFKKTPRYAETMEYCRRLEKASPWIKIVSFGKSPEGRDLVLVVASKEKAFDPKRASKTNKAIVLVQNGIHSGEIDGKDACLMLLRDIAITKKKAALLDHAILLIIPIFNVDGHERFGPFNRINQNGPEEMGWRVTAQNLNLNRDYMKADSPEMQLWLKMFNDWLPDFLVDCHVTDGADFQYVLTYIVERNENLADPVRTWIKKKFVPQVSSTMASADLPIIPYVMFRDDKDPMKGLGGGVGPPRFSTSYAALQNRPALLIETHMLKDYKTRVEATYRFLDVTFQRINEEHTSLRSAVRTADEQTAKELENPFPVRFTVTSKPSDTVHFFGYHHQIEKSEISGTDRIMYTKEPFEMDIPRYNEVVATKSVVPPIAYLIPQQYQEIIQRLKLHGLKLERLKTHIELEIQSYRFSNATWQENPYEGRHPVTYSTEPMTERRSFPPGTVVVRLNQRAARVAIHALEPEAPDAFIAWGFFDAIFEQKEYAEDYVMEAMAKDMLTKDAALKQEFESKLQSDTTFAKSPHARLNFFYQHSPYWDKQINVYPVARLMQRVSLPTEPLQ
jgi:hypothetical protein